MASLTPPPSPSYLTEYRGNSLVAVCSVFIALETVFLGLRFYARHLTKASYGWDDAVLSLAWIINIGLCALCINAVSVAGVGYHLLAVLESENGKSKLVAWFKSIFAVEILYLTASALPKISVLLLYLRIIVSRPIRVICIFLIAFVMASWITFVVAGSLQCLPFAYQWDKTISGGHCFDQVSYYKAASAPNIFTDVFLLFLPFPVVVKLQATLQKKLAILSVFLVGSVGMISSCVRLSIFFQNDAFLDNTWTSVPLMAWTCVEPGVYLIAACLLGLRPLLSKFSFGKWSVGSAGHSGQPNWREPSKKLAHVRYPPSGKRQGFMELESKSQGTADVDKT